MGAIIEINKTSAWLVRSATYSELLEALSTRILHKDKELGELLFNYANAEFPYESFSDFDKSAMNKVHQALTELFESKIEFAQQNTLSLPGWYIFLVQDYSELLMVIRCDERVKDSLYQTQCSINFGQVGVWVGEGWTYDYIMTLIGVELLIQGNLQGLEWLMARPLHDAFQLDLSHYKTEMFQTIYRQLHRVIKNIFYNKIITLTRFYYKEKMLGDLDNFEDFLKKAGSIP
jgi:hypothetical protein